MTEIQLFLLNIFKKITLRQVIVFIVGAFLLSQAYVLWENLRIISDAEFIRYRNSTGNEFVYVTLATFTKFITHPDTVSGAVIATLVFNLKSSKKK